MRKFHFLYVFDYKKKKHNEIIKKINKYCSYDVIQVHLHAKFNCNEYSTLLVSSDVHEHADTPTHHITPSYIYSHKFVINGDLRYMGQNVLTQV